MRFLLTPTHLWLYYLQPYPQNLETALSVEAAVRAEGATPATIAILDGHVCVGLNQEQIETLAQPDANVCPPCYTLLCYLAHYYYRLLRSRDATLLEYWLSDNLAAPR
jgi:hypothetical protein